ncbi:MAG TPA: SAM-dependent methyltransferase [Bacillales bacterium]|nr:SAM-dependent methyltransferase [Bacillales bacterium]
MKTILKQMIEAEPDRSITYEQFMNAVLYHPEKGYYQNSNVKIGRAGDFITSPSVHPVFGRTLARFIMEVMEAERLPLSICELGAGDGRLSEAILREWLRYAPSNAKQIEYFAVEGSPYHREQIRKRLPEEIKVKIYEDLYRLQEEQPSFSGIVFSNEFFDALPVRVVQNVEGVLHEVKITIDEKGELKEVLQLCEDQSIIEWIAELRFPIDEKERVEIPLTMTEVVKELANWIDRGAMLTIDYGHTNEERKQLKRRSGSLRGYHQHQLVEEPLLNPGEMDLTAHIHLDAFHAWAERFGLDSSFKMSQRQFLLNSGILEALRESDAGDPFSKDQRQNRAILTLISDHAFGNAFQVMFHGKDLDGEFLKNWLLRKPIEEAIKKGR